ncbi:MAG: carbohydrate ABC transporter permease [Clostridia bacterium]
MENYKAIKTKKMLTMKGRRKVSNIIYNVFMIILCLVLVFPIIWTICSSFKGMRQIYTETPTNLIPDPFTLENYERIFMFLPMGQMVLTGLLYATVIPCLSMIVASLAAFALARLKFKGSNIVFLLLISTVLGGNGVCLFLFRQYFLSIPRDLENAAIIDGCSWPGVFFRIILPNSKPVLATVAILTFRSTWNSYLWPSLVLQSDKLWTWTLGLKILSDWEMSQAVLMAGAVISILPILIIYVIFQKYFTNSQVGSGFAGT